MKIFLIFGIVALIIILFFVSWIISTTNKIKVLNVKVNEAKSDIEIHLIKRYDVLNESMKAVINFRTHEAEIFRNINLMRPQQGMDVQTMDKMLQEQSNVSRMLMAISFPQIQSSQLYATLQRQLTEENNHVAASKRMYNANVSQYNQYVIQFPVSILGKSQIAFLHDEQELNQKKDASLNWN